MSLKIVGIFLEKYIEVHNTVSHGIQQLGKRWVRGDVVTNEKDIERLRRLGAPIKLYSEYVEEEPKKIEPIVEETQPEVDPEGFSDLTSDFFEESQEIHETKEIERKDRKEKKAKKSF